MRGQAKAWTRAEETKAIALRARGWTHVAIADTLGRPSRAVCWKIGLLLRQFPCRTCPEPCGADDCCDYLADWCEIRMQALRTCPGGLDAEWARKWIAEQEGDNA